MMLRKRRGGPPPPPVSTKGGKGIGQLFCPVFPVLLRPFVPRAAAPPDHPLPLRPAGLPLGVAGGVRPGFPPGGAPHPAGGQRGRAVRAGGRLYPGPVLRGLYVPVGGQPDAQPVHVLRVRNLFHVPAGLCQLPLPGVFRREPLCHRRHPHPVHGPLRTEPALQPPGPPPPGHLPAQRGLAQSRGVLLLLLPDGVRRRPDFLHPPAGPGHPPGHHRGARRPDHLRLRGVGPHDPAPGPGAGRPGGGDPAEADGTPAGRRAGIRGPGQGPPPRYAPPHRPHPDLPGPGGHRRGQGIPLPVAGPAGRRRPGALL